jgi:5-methylcytosine-specific restriction endonuclease McrA
MQSPIPSWTPAKFKQWIISLLRKGTLRWPPRNDVLKAARTGKKLNKLTNRMCFHYKCNKCKKEFPSSKIAVDHIKPVVDVNTGFTTWDDYINRMFCSIHGFQVLCSTCHDKKTEKENIERDAN